MDILENKFIKMGIEYNTEVVSFMIDPIEYFGYVPNMRETLFCDAVTLCGSHVVSVPAMKYVLWTNLRGVDYYARVD